MLDKRPIRQENEGTAGEQGTIDRLTLADLRQGLERGSQVLRVPDRRRPDFKTAPTFLRVCVDTQSVLKVIDLRLEGKVATFHS